MNNIVVITAKNQERSKMSIDTDGNGRMMNVVVEQETDDKKKRVWSVRSK